jgi:putative SOS response-associated peptidase YedK
MCGRFVTPDEREIEDFWHIGRKNWKNPFAGLRETRFNVAPQQGNPQNYIPVIRADADGTLELTDMQWWLLPFWSDVPRIKYTTFNARVESVATSSSFREPFKRRRCLIPARGWFEWQTLPDGKQPWFFPAADAGLLAFAGIWDEWKRDGTVIESCAIIVGDPDLAVRSVHDRQPFVIAQEDQAAWLSPALTDTDAILELLRHPPAGSIAFHRVSKAVGNVSNQGPELVRPEEKATQDGG